jgi:hypothetical protein
MTHNLVLALTFVCMVIGPVFIAMRNHTENEREQL